MRRLWTSYAGGIKTNYRFNEKQLDIADCKIRQLETLTDDLYAKFSGANVYLRA